MNATNDTPEQPASSYAKMPRAYGDAQDRARQAEALSLTGHGHAPIIGTPIGGTGPSVVINHGGPDTAPSPAIAAAMAHRTRSNTR